MLVSVVIPAREWDSRLQSTLATVRTQELPAEVEVESIVGLAGPHPVALPDGVRVVANPSGSIPDALNLAIANASGEVVVRVDSRCDLQHDHMSRVLRRLADPSIGCVGGAQLVLDRGVFGSAYAVAFNSPLLGPSRYRYSANSGPVDTAYLGAWRRDDLIDLGGFDPLLIRNQDNELADRVRASGRTVWYDAHLVVGYRNSRTLWASAAHHHEFGVWRMLQSSQGQRGLHPRHFGALAAVVGGGLVGVVGLLHPSTRRIAVGAAMAGYAAVAGAAFGCAARLRRKRPDIEGPRFNAVGVAFAPVVATAVDVAWLAGVLRGWSQTRGRVVADLAASAPPVR